MRINLPQNIKFPEKFYIACSGGVDSMAIVSFLNNSHKNFDIVHFNHGTENAHSYEAFVRNYGAAISRNVIVSSCEPYIKSPDSKELYWARKRHEFFNSFDAPVITAHHLNDVVETWLMSCLNGKPHLMPWKTRNCLRPFLLTKKEGFISWCKRFNVPWIEDMTNADNDCYRNNIRNNLLPNAVNINSGLFTNVSKLLTDSWIS